MLPPVAGQGARNDGRTRNMQRLATLIALVLMLMVLMASPALANVISIH